MRRGSMKELMRPEDFEPTALAYQHTIRVESADIDEFGHANNVVWVRWVNEAAIAHSTSVGFNPEVLVGMHTAWIIRKHEIEYLAPAYAGELLQCFTWPAAVRGATSVRRNVFLREGKLLARAETLWAFMNIQTGRPTRVTVEMMNAYGYSVPESRQPKP